LSPDEVINILNKAEIRHKEFGKKFGTVLAIVGAEKIEITTFRRESRYSDQRHPDRVEFIREYLDDARRRDLTINALYFDPISGILFDPVKGLDDLEKKIIRFVGDPKKRIDEDPLRMLRAVRLAIILNFKLEKNSFAAIKTRAKLIQSVALQRIQMELAKIFRSEDYSGGLEILKETGLAKFVIKK
jgi:tRNA nucleotidyltransferase (CCA-adding enzyme)